MSRFKAEAARAVPLFAPLAGSEQLISTVSTNHNRDCIGGRKVIIELGYSDPVLQATRFRSADLRFDTPPWKPADFIRSNSQTKEPPPPSPSSKMEEGNFFGGGVPGAAACGLAPATIFRPDGALGFVALRARELWKGPSVVAVRS